MHSANREVSEWELIYWSSRVRKPILKQRKQTKISDPIVYGTVQDKRDPARRQQPAGP